MSNYYKEHYYMIGQTFTSGGYKYVLGMGANGIRPYYLGKVAVGSAMIPGWGWAIAIGVGALAVGVITYHAINDDSEGT